MIEIIVGVTQRVLGGDGDDGYEDLYAWILLEDGVTGFEDGGTGVYSVVDKEDCVSGFGRDGQVDAAIALWLTGLFAHVHQCNLYHAKPVAKLHGKGFDDGSEKALVDTEGAGQLDLMISCFWESVFHQLPQDCTTVLDGDQIRRMYPTPLDLSGETFGRGLQQLRGIGDDLHIKLLAYQIRKQDGEFIFQSHLWIKEGVLAVATDYLPTSVRKRVGWILAEFFPDAQDIEN